MDNNNASHPTRLRQQAITSIEYAIKDVTAENYAKIVLRLQRYSSGIQECWKEGHVHYDLTPLDLVADLVDRRDLSPRTKATYCYALKWHFRQDPIDSAFAEAEAALDLFIEVGLSSPHTTKSQTKRPKAIPPAHLERLLNEMTDRSAGHSDWAGIAGYWFRASLATGLRPIEWLDVQWKDNDKNILVVINSKIKADTAGFLRETELEFRSSHVAATREIPVERDYDRMCVEQHMTNMSHLLAKGYSFETIHKHSAQVIRRACNKLWKNGLNYTLYSARKQFAADVRAAVGPIEAAKLMGHGRADTPSAAAYGSANQAYSRVGLGYRQNTNSERSEEISNQIKGERVTEQSFPSNSQRQR